MTEGFHFTPQDYQPSGGSARAKPRSSFRQMATNAGAWVDRGLALVRGPQKTGGGGLHWLAAALGALGTAAGVLGPKLLDAHTHSQDRKAEERKDIRAGWRHAPKLDRPPFRPNAKLCNDADVCEQVKLTTSTSGKLIARRRDGSTYENCKQDDSKRSCETEHGTLTEVLPTKE